MGESIASLFESVLFPIFLTLFLEAKKGRKKVFAGIVITAILLFLNIYISDRYGIYNVYALIADLVITAVYWGLFLKGSLSNFLLGFALYHFGLYFTVNFSTYLISLVEPKMVLTFQSIGTAYRNELLIISKTMLSIYAIIILYYRKKFLHQKRGIFMLCYSIFPIIVLMCFVLLTSTLAELYKMEVALSARLISIMIEVHFIVIAAIYLSIHAVRKAEEEYDVERLNYMLQVQRESLERFIGQERELHRLRHELEHKLFTVQYLFEKNKSEEGFLVLKQMVEELCGDAKDILVSQNIVDTVISNIEHKFEAERIRLEKEVQFRDETIIELVDLCILLGDLLDNAMEAAAESGEKRVEISVKEEYGCLYIRVANTFSLKGSDVKSFASHKKEAEKHGFGMRNIREIVRRYAGELIFYDEEGWFYTDIVIYGQK